MNNVKHAVTVACAEVVGVNTRAREHLLDSLDVTECKVNNVDVITHARSVGCGVVVAVNVEVVKLADEVGAILCYPYLGDVGESPTGDKKAQKFEDDYLDEVVPYVKELGFNSIAYMPSRNTLEQLQRLMKLCKENDLFEIL